MFEAVRSQPYGDGARAVLSLEDIRYEILFSSSLPVVYGTVETDIPSGRRYLMSHHRTGSDGFTQGWEAFGVALPARRH